MSKPVTIELVVDSSGAVSGIRQADGSVIKLGSTVDKTGKKVKSFGGAFDVALGSLAAGAVAQLTQGLRNLVRGGVDLLGASIRAAGVQDIAEGKLSQALLNLGDSSEKSRARLHAAAAEVQSFSNFGDEAIITAQAMLGSFKSVAGAEGIEMLTPRLADMAAGVAKATGETVDLNGVAAQLGKALEGGAAGLRRYGVSLSDTQASALDAAKGMDKVRMLSEILDSNFAGLAKATADPFKQLQNSAGDFQEVIGAGLLPAAREIAVRLMALSQNEAVIDAVREASAKMGAALIYAADAAETAYGFLRDNRETISAVAKVTGVLTAAVLAWHAGAVVSSVATRALAAATWLYNNASRAAAIGQRLLNLAMKANPIGLIISAITIVVGLIWTFRKNIVEAAATFAQWVAGLIKGLRWIDRLAQALGMSNGLSGMLENAADSLSKMGEGMDDAGDSASGLTGEVEETTGATDNLSGSMDNLTESADKVKGVLAQAREQVKKLTAELRDLHAASPDVVADLKLQEQAIKDQIDAREDLIDSIVRRRAEESAGAQIGEIPLDFEMPDGAIELPELPMGTIDFGDPLGDVLPEWKHQFESAVAEWGPSVQQAMSVIGDYSRAAHQAKMQQIEEEEAAELERFDVRIARIDEQLAAEEISDERRAELEAQKRGLVAQREAAEDKYEKQRREATRAQARREKQLALVQIAFETAKNVVAAFGNPFKMAAAAALGVAQAAVVARQPLPLNRGGFVPGGGADEDSVLAYLTPGEAVITRRSAQANAGLIDTLNRYPGVRMPRDYAADRASLTRGGASAGDDRLLEEVRMLRRDVGRLDRQVNVMIDRSSIHEAYDSRQRELDRNEVT